jgi:hypothetical protein
MLEEYTIEIASVTPPPIKIKMCDALNCPICDIDLLDELNIDLEKFEIDNNTSIHCVNCDLKINFDIVKI